MARREDRLEAQRLRSQGYTLDEICLKVSAGKGTVYPWIKDVAISKRGQVRRDRRKALNLSKMMGNSHAWGTECRDRREAWRKEGFEYAKRADTGHAMMCVMYWAEGKKTQNQMVFVNSDLAMVKLFIEQMIRVFGLSDGDFHLTISAYTDVYSKEEIISYWVDGIGLSAVMLGKHDFDPGRYKSKGNRPSVSGRCPYGVCAVKVKNGTRFLQHVYGALEKYAGASLGHDGKRKS